MIVHRVLREPEPFQRQADGQLAWGVYCLLDDGYEDAILFTDEDTAWSFYHDVNMRFEPLEIGNEDDA